MSYEARGPLLVGQALFFAFICTVQAQCYYPNHTVVPWSDYQPCPAQIGGVSMCCATNRTSGADTCLANGLCSNAIENSQGTGALTIFWRESCSDQTWKSPFCLNLCTRGSGIVSPPNGSVIPDYSAADILVTQCPDLSYCCGLSNDTCCKLGQGVKIASIVGQSITSSTTSATSTSSTTSSTSGTTTTGPSTPDPAPPDSLGTGAKIGIGVGVGVGSILLAAVAGAWFLRRRKKKAENTPVEPNYMPVHNQKSPQPEDTISEIKGTPIMHEMPSPRPGHEIGHARQVGGLNELEGSPR